jgi:hypothetical protein
MTGADWERQASERYPWDRGTGTTRDTRATDRYASSWRG